MLAPVLSGCSSKSVGTLVPTCPTGIELLELSSQFGVPLLFPVRLLSLFGSWWFCETSQPGHPLIFVPTNAATGLDVLQDYYHPETAVVGAGTSHPHAGFEHQDLRITNGFSLIPREHRSILRTASTTIEEEKKVLFIHSLVLLVLQCVIKNPGLTKAYCNGSSVDSS